MTHAVEVAGLRHRYGARVALDGVSFTVAAGELFGVIGPNGSGKSTLFSLLNSSRRVQDGRIAIGGVETGANVAEARRRIGIVFQRPTLDKYLTCRENLHVHAVLQGISGSATAGRVTEALAAAGLSDRSNDLASSLSGGLARRLELARALLHLPAVLLLDEPAGSLDPAARGELWTRLGEWRRARGLTVLVTTHDMGEALRCDRLALLDAGRIIATGTPAELTGALGEAIVSIRTENAAGVSRIIRDQFKAEPLIVGNEVRFAAPGAHALVGALAAACGPAASSIAVGAPTLDDVFVARTGHRFDGASS